MLEAALTTSEMAAVNKVWFGNVLSEIFMCQLTTMAVMMVNFYMSSFFDTISAHSKYYNILLQRSSGNSYFKVR